MSTTRKRALIILIALGALLGGTAAVSATGGAGNTPSATWYHG